MVEPKIKIVDLDILFDCGRYNHAICMISKLSTCLNHLYPPVTAVSLILRAGAGQCPPYAEGQRPQHPPGGEAGRSSAWGDRSPSTLLGASGLRDKAIENLTHVCTSYPSVTPIEYTLAMCFTSASAEHPHKN